jgi:hypothetical protein
MFIKGLPSAIPLFLLGSLPLWIYNVTSGLATFATQQNADPISLEQTGLILTHYWNDLLPRMVSGDPSWNAIGPRGFILLLSIYYAGQLALLAWPFIGPWKGRKGFSLRMMLAAMLISVPLIYIVSSYGVNALNPWGLDATGRYVLMMHTTLPVGVAALVISIASLQRKPLKMMSEVSIAVALSTAASVLILNLLGAIRTDTFIAFNSPYYDRSQEDLNPLVAYLDEEHIKHVWIDTAIGNVLMFTTQERILAGDYYDVIMAGGRNRTPNQWEAVYKAEKTAYVIVVQPGQQNPPLQQALDKARVNYLFKAVTSTLYVYIPNRRVDPEEIASGLGYQYWTPPPAK